MKLLPKLLLLAALACATSQGLAASQVGSVSVSPTSVGAGQTATITANVNYWGVECAGNLTIKVTRPDGSVSTHSIYFGPSEPASKSIVFTPNSGGLHSATASVSGSYKESGGSYAWTSFTSTWCPSVSFTVAAGDTTPPDAPAMPTISDVTDTSFRVHWTKPNDDFEVDFYYVHVKRPDGTGVYNLPISSTASSLSTNVDGLTQGTSYVVTIRARDAAQNFSGYSPEKAQQTIDTENPDAPAAPAVVAHSVTPTSIGLSWSRPDDNIGVKGYQVERLNPDGTTYLYPAFDFDEPSVAFTLTGLTQGNAYRARVKAKDGRSPAPNWSGWSGYSAAQLAPQALSVNRSATQAYGTSQTLGASGGAGGGAVTYAIVGHSASDVATLSGSTLTANASSGWVDVQATKAADGNYSSATSAAARVTFQKAGQAALSVVRSSPQTHAASQTLSSSGGSGGGAVTYAIVDRSAGGAATLSGSTLAANVGTGWVDVQATKAGDGNYNAATSATARVIFQKAEQATVSLAASSSQTYGTSQTLGASGGSGGGSVSYAIVGQSASGVATLSGSTLTATAGTGWVDVQATKAADGNFNSKASSTVRVSFAKAGQAVLAVSRSATQTYATSQTLVVSGGSGSGSVTYAIVGQSASGVATLSGSTLTANAGTGWVDVQATKAGDGNYNAATSATARVTFQKAGQAALAVARSATQTYATSQTLGVSGGSGGGAVSYAIVGQSAGGAATLSGSTLAANVGTGWADVQATKAGDGNYNAATSATARVTFQKAEQATVSVAATSSQTYGTSQTLGASGGSGGGAVSYAIVGQSAGGVATLSGSTLAANAGTGWVDVQATKAADSNFNSKASSTVRVSFAKAPQPALAVARSATQTYAASQTLGSSGGGGSGAVTYAIVGQSASGVATLSGSTLAANAGAGWVDVQATKAGDDNYNAATSPAARVTFQKAGQAALSVVRSSPQTHATSQTLSSSGGSGGGAVTYAIVGQSAGGVATLSGSTLSADAATGWVDVQATKAGDGNYNAKSSAAARVTFQGELAPPENVVVYVSETFCQIEWSHAQDNPRIARYEVKFDGAISNVPLSVHPERPFKEFSSLAKGSTHTLAARSVDAAGIVSDWSETKTITTHSFSDGRGVAEVVVTPKVATNGDEVTIAVVMAEAGTASGGYKNGSLSVGVRNPMGSTSSYSYQYLQFPATVSNGQGGQITNPDPNYNPANPSIHKFAYTPSYDGEHSASAVLSGTKYSESVPMTGLTTSVYPSIAGYPDTFVFNDTVSAPPTVPAGIEAFSVGTQSFGLKWKGSYDAKGVAGYEARIAGGETASTGGTTTYFNNLQAGASYSVEVRAQDVDGEWSAWSSPQTVTTASYPADDLDGDGIPNASDSNPHDAANALQVAPGDADRSQYDAYYYAQHPGEFRKAEAAKPMPWMFTVSAPGTGSVTITAKGEIGVYDIVDGKGQFVFASRHPVLHLREGETVSVTASSSGLSEYTVQLKPYTYGSDDWKRVRVLYDGEPSDGFRKAPASPSAFAVGLDVASRAPFAMLDSSDLETARLLKLGLGADFRGRSSGYLAIDLGAYGHEFSDTHKNRATVELVKGIDAVVFETAARMQAKAPSGWMDAQYSGDGARLDVLFYPPDGVALSGAFRDFGSAEPMASYRFDLAEPEIGQPGLAIVGLRGSQRLRVQRTVGSHVGVYEIQTDRHGSRAVMVGNAAPDGYPTELTTETLKTYVKMYPWRAPLAPKSQMVAFSYAHTDAQHVSATYKLDVSGTPYLGRQVWEEDEGLWRILSNAHYTYPKHDRYLEGRPGSTYRHVGMDRQFVSAWRNAEMDGEWDYFKRNNELETAKDGALVFRERYRPKLSRVVGWNSGQSVGGVVEEGNMDAQSAIAEGKIREERRSFLDSEALGGATDIVTHFTYHPIMYDGKVRAHVETVTQGAAELGKTVLTYSDTRTFGNKATLETTRIDYASASDPGLTTIAWSYSASSPVGDDLKERPISVLRPDGTKTSYAYQRGSLNMANGNWTASASGSHFLLAELSGKAGSGAASFTPQGGSAIAVDPLDMQDYRSTVSERVVDNRGNVLREATYVSAGSATFALVASTYHAYDAFGHLVWTANAPSAAAGRSILYEAEYEGLLKASETDASGVVTLYDYDDRDRVESVTKEGFGTQPAIVTGIKYDGANRVVERVDGVGATGAEMVATFKYDLQGRVVERRDPGVANPTTFAYDAPANPYATVVTLPTGAEQIASRYRDGKPKALAGSAAIAESYLYAYQPDGQLKTTRVYTATGQRSSSYSDWLGRTVRTDEKTYEGLTDRVTLSIHNALGQLARVEVRDGVSGPRLLPDSRYEYDAYGRLERTGSDSDDSGGNLYLGQPVLNLQKDANLIRYETKFELRDGTKWDLVERQHDYPYAGSATERKLSEQFTQLCGFGAGNLSWSYGFDAFGNKTDSLASVNRQTRTATSRTRVFGGNNQQIGGDIVSTSINGLLTSSTNAQGHATTYAYDAVGRLQAETDPRVGDTTYAYVPNAPFLQSVAAPDGVQSYNSYDAHGRLAWQKTWKSGSGLVEQYQRYAYNLLGNVTEIWGSGANPVRYTYDDLGRPKTQRTYRAESSWQAEAKPSAFADDAQGDLTTWEYQPLTGLLLWKQDAASKKTTYAYDPLGRVATRLDPRGVSTSYQYYAQSDAGSGAFTGALKLIDYPNSAVNGVPVTTDVAYAYHRAGGYKTVTDATGTRTFDYYETPSATPTQASAGLLKQETLGADLNSRAIVSTYHFGEAGQLNGTFDGFAYSGGYQVGYDFASAGRLSSVAPGSGGSAFAYAYAPNSNLLESVERGAFKRSHEYEPNSHRLSALQHRHSGVLKSEIRAAYDGLGRKSVEKHWGEVPTALGRPAGVATDYHYNATLPELDPQPEIDRNELIMSGKRLLDGTSTTPGWTATSTLVPASARGYAHDAIGNRMLADDAYVPNNLNQYASVGGTAFSYDLNGNLTSDGARTYTYDAENRLVKVVKSGNTYDYVYDYMGRRVSKKKNGANEVRFVYAGWNLVAETNASGAILRKYTWGSDVSGTLQGAGGVGGLLMIEDGSESYYPIYDSGANVVGLRDQSGNLDAAYDYDAFGGETARAGSYAAANPFRFSTKYTDEDTGLIYYGLRFYDPELGRFINRDPIQEAGGLNLYGFVGNDPANRYDYLGLNDETKGEVVGIITIGSEEGGEDQAYAVDTDGDGDADGAYYLNNDGQYVAVPQGLVDGLDASINGINREIWRDGVDMYMMERDAMDSITQISFPGDSMKDLGISPADYESHLKERYPGRDVLHSFKTDGEGRYYDHEWLVGSSQAIQQNRRMVAAHVLGVAEFGVAATASLTAGAGGGMGSPAVLSWRTLAGSKLANFSKLEKGIIGEARGILNNKAFKEAVASGKPTQLTINGRTVIIEPNAPMSGMTLFDEGSFVIGREALGSADELSKTVLHELHRLNTSVRTTGAGLGQAAATAETGAAAAFSERAFGSL